MATISTLPPTLRSKLAAVARHIRFLRLVRGLSLLLLVLTLTGAAALLADFLLDLPAVARAVLLATWLALGTLTAVLGLVVPLCRRLAPESLAALIEEKYPDLGERLTSTVELSGDQDAYHGSRALIALLVDDTETRTHGLNFARAVPARRIGLLAAGTAVVLALAFSPALAWRDPYVQLGQRFLLPWRTPPTVAPYVLELTPGDLFAATGRPLTLTVHVTPRNDHIALPTACTLVLTGADGNTVRRPTTVERQDTFSLTLDRLAGSFTYHAEAGAAVSDDYRITAVEPVELAADSPTLTVTPPEYARKTIHAETLHGFQDTAALQYSRLAFDFRFTRPAVAATLEWTPRKDKDTPDHAVQAVVLPLDLNADALGAHVELPAAAAGSYRVVLKADHDIVTELGPRTLTVQLDQPPAFTKTALNEELKAVLAYDRVPVELTVADDVGVAQVRLQYQVNNGPLASEPIALKGAGTQEASARYLFDLGGKVKEGDQVRYRLEALDNRSVPEHDLKPNATYYPAKDRWLTLKIVRQAQPLREQEVLAQRDEVNRRLESIQDRIKSEQRGVYKVRQESRNQQDLTPDQQRQTKELRQENRGIENALREVAREATAPALQKIAEQVQAISDEEMHRSEADLHRAENAKEPQPRTEQFQKADEELTKALRRVEDLRKQNERIARERLDQAKLEMAAEREKQLAEKARELAAQDPVKDPNAAKQTEQLRREQNDVANELQRLADQSEPLREALDAARAEQAKQLAEKARELAQQQRDLTAAEKNTNPMHRDQLADLAHKQQELAEKARHLAQETKQASQTARTAPLKPEEAKKAAEALKDGDAGEAVKHQDQAARELDRLANDLDRAIDLAKDPREAAKQLSRLEEDLQKRLNEETHKKDAKTPLGERINALRREQNALSRAAEQLSVPPRDPAAQQDRREAAEHAAKASDVMLRQDPHEALAHMDQTRQALQRLADRLPNLEQRQQQARAEVAQLRQQQDQIANMAEQAVKQVEKRDPNAARTRAQLAERLADAARKQAETAERLGKLDAPKQEPRQQRVQETLNRALTDLMDARPQDVPASQQAARRELERLEQALSGQKPADEKARELADRQQKLAADAAHLAADPKTAPEKQQELQRKQQQLAQEAQGLQAPEAPQRQTEAAEAARKAAQAAQTKPADPGTHKQMQDAAHALDRLAQQMTGQESEAARAERLARRQAEAAAEAKNQPAATPEAQRRQQQIADEAKQLRAGEEGQVEKQKALEALNKAQSSRPPDQPKDQRAAADALRDLADRLAGRKDAAEQAHAQPGAKPVQHLTGKPNPSPRHMAQELAKQQNELARSTQQAQNKADAKPAPQGKEALKQALEQIGKQQQQLNQQASQLPANQAQKALEQARQAMNQARKALGKNDADQAQQKQREAAGALERLAQQLPDKAPVVRQQEPAQPAEGMPKKRQTEQARDLAQQQRDLGDAVRKLTQAPPTPGQASPIGELIKQQQEIARQAAELAKNVAQEQGQQGQPTRQAQQAVQSAKQTAGKMQAGALPEAKTTGEKTAQQLRQLAQQMSQTPRGQGADPHAADPVRQARDLAQRQEDVNRQLQPQVNNAAAQQAQQQLQQQVVQQQTTELTQELNRLAQQLSRTPQAQQAANQAAQSGQQAQGQMQQAQQQGQQGNQGQMQQGQQQAAQSLDRAAQQAAQAGQQTATGQQPQAGQAVPQAQGQMQQAQQQLGQGKPQGAQKSMQQAAQALQQAAQQLAQQQSQPQQNSDPGPRGASGEGRVDASLLGPDMQKHAGKRWGELPGELRTKILQDMKAKYGEDYARIIKLYFEQIADTKKK